MTSSIVMISTSVSTSVVGITTVLLNVSDTFEPRSGNFLGSIPIYDNMHYEMDITIYGYAISWSGILSCISGLNGVDRYPEVKMHPLVDNYGFYVHMEGAGEWSGGQLMVGETHHLEADWTQSMFTVKMDGEFAYEQKTTHTTGIIARCWSWLRTTKTTIPPANATVSNLLITTTGMSFTFRI